jgi:hypothetical protein
VLACARAGSAAVAEAAASADNRVRRFIMSFVSWK